MQIDRLMDFILVFVIASFSAGCSSAREQLTVRTQMPIDWSVASSTEVNDCNAIDGSYQVQGVGRFGNEPDLKQSRLDADLGYAYPTKVMPKNLRISVDDDSKILSLYFDNSVYKVPSQVVNCENGWWAFEQQLIDEYLGDGGEIDKQISKVFLAKASDGALIVHLKVDVTYSSLMVVKQRELRESWTKYKKVNQPE